MIELMYNGKFYPANLVVEWKERDKRGETVEISKIEKKPDENNVASLEMLQNQYAAKFEKPVPLRYKNDENWITLKLHDSE